MGYLKYLIIILKVIAYSANQSCICELLNQAQILMKLLLLVVLFLIVVAFASDIEPVIISSANSLKQFVEGAS